VHAGPAKSNASGEGERSETSTNPPSPTASLTHLLEGQTARAWREAAVFLHRILCDIARASDLPPSVWDDILDGTLTMPDDESQVTYTLMRLFRYFPTTGFAAEHTDLGLLTLCVGDGPGLQVVNRVASGSNGKQPVWVDAPAGTHQATVLIGTTLYALSSRTLKPGLHRVVGNPDGRSSVVFALRHSTKHNVDFGPFGGEGSATPQEVWMKVQAGKVNINSVKEKRDLQTAKFAAERLKAQGLRQATTMGQG